LASACSDCQRPDIKKLIKNSGIIIADVTIFDSKKIISHKTV
jgi:hypothetical protein